jgi:hypothetical protein
MGTAGESRKPNPSDGRAQARFPGRLGRRQLTETAARPCRLTSKEAAMDDHDLKPGDEAQPGTPGSGEDVCPVCKGSGRIDSRACANCEGTGVIERGIGGG